MSSSITTKFNNKHTKQRIQTKLLIANRNEFWKKVSRTNSGLKVEERTSPRGKCSQKLERVLPLQTELPNIGQRLNQPREGSSLNESLRQNLWEVFISSSVTRQSWEKALKKNQQKPTTIFEHNLSLSVNALKKGKIILNKFSLQRF